jgi:hypothetical protein
MKTRLLIVIGSIFIAFVLLYIFVLGAIGQCDLPLTFCTNFDKSNLGGGLIDLDPDLSHSYSQEFVWYAFLIPVIFPTIIIVTLFVGTFAILKRKNIPSRPYLVLILAGILLFFIIPNFVSSLEFIPYLMSHPEQIRPYIFEQILFRMWWQIVILTIVGILLYRSSVIRNLIKK